MIDLKTLRSGISIKDSVPFTLLTYYYVLFNKRLTKITNKSLIFGIVTKNW